MRRHLTESQKALVAIEALPLFAKEAKARQIRKPDSVSAPVREQNDGAVALEPTRKTGKAAAAAGKAIGVSSRFGLRGDWGNCSQSRSWQEIELPGANPKRRTVQLYRSLQP